MSCLFGFYSELCSMFIKAVKKWRRTEGDSQYPYKYYRLCESYRDENSRACRRMVIGLGELTNLPSEKDRTELANLLTLMIEKNACLQKTKRSIIRLWTCTILIRPERAVILQEADKQLKEEARTLYPYSELKTVDYLRENSAWCEMFNINPAKVTKDVLYKSAKNLYYVHREMEARYQ